MKKYDFQVPSYSMSAIFNGDFSGLNESETKEIKNFLDGIVKEYGVGHWSFNDSESYFSHVNDLNNFASDVCDIEYIVI